MTAPYDLLCMQIITKSVHGHSVSKARQIIRDNLKYSLNLLDDALGFRASHTKLVLFPEFFLMGYPTTESIDQWLKMACINIPGEETDALGEKAKQYGIYIAGNCYATYEDWPKRYDNTSFIVDPQGHVVHVYRRIITSYGYSPHDILDDFVAKYGEKALFPVTNTPLGNLAIFPCGEVTIPEVARCFALNGAEVFLHPHGGGIPSNGPYQICCRARAYENMAYFATAASALLTPAFPAGGSAIYDYGGRILTRAMEGPIEAFVQAPIDITHLRALRKMANPLARLRLEVFAPVYQTTSIWPPNRFLKTPIKDLKDIDQSQKLAFENMKKRQILTPP